MKDNKIKLPLVERLKAAADNPPTDAEVEHLTTLSLLILIQEKVKDVPEEYRDRVLEIVSEKLSGYCPNRKSEY